MRKKPTRYAFAAEIQRAWQKTTDGIFDTGRALIAAKGGLSHGEFLAMVREDCPFSPRTAQVLMSIARNPVLADAQRAALLPPCSSTLAKLTGQPPDLLLSWLRAGKITPKTKRKDVAALLGNAPTKKEPTAVIIVSGTGTLTPEDLLAALGAHEGPDGVRDLLRDTLKLADDAFKMAEAVREAEVQAAADARDVPRVAALMGVSRSWAKVHVDSYELVSANVLWSGEPRGEA